MRITLDITKTLDENAQVYFEKSKKAKKKLEGAREALILHKEKLKKLEKEGIADEKRNTKKEKVEVKREWYEKYRWFISSEGYLCISGMDATTNEIIVKKHMLETDVVLHTEMSGSPFTIVKVEKKDSPSEVTLDEAAQFTMAYSRAWKMGVANIPVFHVKPEQVSKTPNPGEFVAKGSFIIRGKTTYLHPLMEICVGVAKDGVHEGRVIAGSASVMEKHARIYAALRQGTNKASNVAKELLKRFDLKGSHNLDDLIRYIPNGGVQVKIVKKLKV